MSATFLDVLDRTRTLLENNPNLSEFCLDRWGYGLTAEIGFRHRREIAFSELPLVLITRPQVTSRSRHRHGREGTHTMRLYAGFQNPDMSAGARELIEFEELIEDALTGSNPFRDLCLSAEVGDSANDEGAQPPAFFLVVQVNCLYRRNTK